MKAGTGFTICKRILSFSFGKMASSSGGGGAVAAAASWSWWHSHWVEFFSEELFFTFLHPSYSRYFYKCNSQYNHFLWCSLFIFFRIKPYADFGFLEKKNGQNFSGWIKGIYKEESKNSITHGIALWPICFMRPYKKKDSERCMPIVQKILSPHDLND